MTSSAAYLGQQARQTVWRGPVIDCDVHCDVPSLESLHPYMDPLWVQWAQERGWRGPSGVRHVYPPNAPSTARPEWRAGSSVPASEVGILRNQILDPWEVERAVLNCYYAVDSLRHPDWASALASAVNDYVKAEYLDKDPRLVASLVVPARDPAAMVREIQRIGGEPGFVQVLMPARSDRPYGQRIYHPVLQAIAEHDLVMGLHWGGTCEDAPSPTGWPSWYVEEYAAEWQIFATQVTSLVAEGVFQAFPSLRVSVLEGGFTWLPIWGWRMNKEWKALRREVPWLDRPPFDLIREHFRFSIAPIDAGPREAMRKLLEWLESDALLMFATDYPHFHDDDIAAFLETLPSEEMRRNVMSETARAWYRFPQ